MTNTAKSSSSFGVLPTDRDSFKRGQYQDVILPFTVTQAVDSVIAQTSRRSIEDVTTS